MTSLAKKSVELNFQQSNISCACLYYREMKVSWFIQKVKMLSNRWFTHVFLTVCMILYSILGGIIFMALEGPNENIEVNRIKQERDRTVLNYREVFISKVEQLCDHYASTKDCSFFLTLFENYLDVYDYNFNKTNYFLYNYDNAIKKKWKFWNSILYAGTVYSTIGFGYASPKTMPGRFATIIYAIIGIPLFLIVLADFGKVFTRNMKWAIAVVKKIFRKTKNIETGRKRSTKRVNVEDGAFTHQCFEDDFGKQQPSDDKLGANKVLESSKETENQKPDGDDDNFNLPVIYALLTLTTYMFFGAATFSYLQSWSLSESFYFVFVSMSTIGLGDFVPRIPLHMMMVLFYLTFGLALTSMCINVVQDKLKPVLLAARNKLAQTVNIDAEKDDDLENNTSPETESSEGISQPSDFTRDSTPL